MEGILSWWALTSRMGHVLAVGLNMALEPKKKTCVASSRLCYSLFSSIEVTFTHMARLPSVGTSLWMAMTWLLL